MALQCARFSIVAARLALGAALLVPLFASGEEPLVPMSPSSSSGATTDKDFVGPPLPPVQEFVGPPVPPLTENVMNALDTSRDYLSGKLLGFVSNIDQFFGDERHYQESNDSVFQMDINRTMGYSGEHRYVISGRANVHLPIAEKKLHLLLETNPDKNAIVDPKQPQPQPANEPATPQSLSAALRYIRDEAEHWHVSLDGGLKFQGLNTTPFVRSRFSLAIPVEEWRVKLAETAFWFNTIGAGETTQLDVERTISEPLLFRATSVSTWLNDMQNFDLRQSFTVFHKLDERTAVQYQVGALGASKPVTQVTDYFVLVAYRYRLHQNWMYCDVSPQVHFPRERSFHSSGMLALRLEMLFDESSKR
jgi:hypothetical protein